MFQREADFYSLLATSDVQLSFVSTVMIESALLGKPSLGLQPALVPDPTGMLEAGLYEPVALETLSAQVTGLLADEGRLESLAAQQRQAAAEWCLFDGRSLERCYQLVERLLAGRDG